MDVLTQIDRDRIASLRAHDEFFWLDLVAPSDADLDALGELLELHELAMEDTREFGQRPKLDRYHGAVLLVFYSARADQDEKPVEMIEVHLHISGGWLFTARQGACLALDRLHETLVPGVDESEEYMIYRVLDALTDALFPVITELERRIDALEERVLSDTDREQLSHIYRLKQQVQSLLRLMVPQREQFGAATEAILGLPGLEQGSRAYLRDIGDHLAQVT